MEWQRSDPVYPVADVAVSIEWYRRVFGFEPRVVNPPSGKPVYAVLLSASGVKGIILDLTKLRIELHDYFGHSLRR